jgi:hypothetical protein
VIDFLADSDSIQFKRLTLDVEEGANAAAPEMIREAIASFIFEILFRYIRVCSKSERKGRIRS